MLELMVQRCNRLAYDPVTQLLLVLKSAEVVSPLTMAARNAALTYAAWSTQVEYGFLISLQGLFFHPLVDFNSSTKSAVSVMLWLKTIPCAARFSTRL